MSVTLDRYDVEAMIRDAGYRFATRDALHECASDLRAGLAEARGEIATLRANLEDLTRVVHSRTDHLA